jgi:broad specificity phosphatase PhoE
MSAPAPVAPVVMIIRHAEKPADTPPPAGVNIDGVPDDQSLIPQGWQRAGALAVLFDPFAGALQSPQLRTPQYLFAAGTGHHSHSLRPQQTLTPLADRLNLAINATFLKDDWQPMVAAALQTPDVVLICWEHKNIPSIAGQIPVLPGTSIPQQWPGGRFDVIWLFTLQPASNAYQFSQVPQNLLAGDQNTPIDVVAAVAWNPSQPIVNPSVQAS